MLLLEEASKDEELLGIGDAVLLVSTSVLFLAGFEPSTSSPSGLSPSSISTSGGFVLVLPFSLIVFAAEGVLVLSSTSSDTVLLEDAVEALKNEAG